MMKISVNQAIYQRIQVEIAIKLGFKVEVVE